MAKKPLILAIDQGTTSSRAMVFDQAGAIIGVAQAEFAQHYPTEGWVEHDPTDIWQTVLGSTREALAKAEKDSGGTVVSIGITNQRETTLVWDRKTGEPIYNALVWQDRRTADLCAKLKQAGHEAMVVSEKTGLLLDPYFSATKVAWILDHVEGARSRAKAGELAFGTVDTYLLWHLTGGKVHATDVTNASRTNLLNIHDLDWDDALLDLFRVPRAMMPEVKECAAEFGNTDAELLGRAIPIQGIAGDQQAAAIGQACFTPGSIKSTYGTGCFVLVNTGNKPVRSENRLLTTVGYKIKGETAYAIEGSIFIAGAAVQWLRDELGIIRNAAQTEALARSLKDNGGVYLVPAFTGLGAPHWDPHARGSIHGLTRGTGRAHIARAALESVVYQTADLLSAMQSDGVKPAALRVDGGMVLNDWAMQFLADMLNLKVERPQVMETTALGAAYLAGLQAGLFASLDEVAALWQRDHMFTPSVAPNTRDDLMLGWKKAVERTLSD